MLGRSDRRRITSEGCMVFMHDDYPIVAAQRAPIVRARRR